MQNCRCCRGNTASCAIFDHFRTNSWLNDFEDKIVVESHCALHCTQGSDHLCYKGKNTLRTVERTRQDMQISAVLLYYHG